jgi:hypothetical protein
VQSYVPEGITFASAEFCEASLSPDEDSTSSTELLLVSDNFSELDDTSFALLLDFPVFSLLDEPSSTEEDDSIPDSSVDPADADDESSHAAQSVTMLNATKIFFIKTPSPQRFNLSSGNIIIFTYSVHFM